MRIYTKLFLALLCVAFHPSCTYAQNTAIEQYNQFRQQAQKDYADFRRKCNAEYAEFLKSAWESYIAGPIIPKPKDETVPPVVMPDDDRNKPIDSNPVPIDTVVIPINDEPTPQPKPIVPIYEQPEPVPTYLSFSFFGTEGKVRVPKESSNSKAILGGKLTGESLADAWEQLSNGDYDNLMRDCLELRIRYNLCDWAYLQMIRELSEAYYDGRSNAATFFMAWIYCQTGYQMRLAITDNKLYLLIGTRHQIYDMGSYKIDGTLFYPFLHKGEKGPDRVQICGASFPEEQPLSLFVPYAQNFSQNYGSTRTIQSDRYPNASASVKVNQNLMKFYETYPTSMLDDNFITRWAMYANTPMAEDVKSQLYPQLRNHIQGKSQLDAANILLNWVQTGFVYEYDEKVWGGDRAFFAEESLNYPYCDCEDRSILYTRLIRDLVGLDCILIYYPGHLACAVHFTENVSGDYINLDGYKFVVTDPTFIGAPVGYTMTGMDNKAAKVILLSKNHYEQATSNHRTGRR